MDIRDLDYCPARCKAGSFTTAVRGDDVAAVSGQIRGTVTFGNHSPHRAT